MPARKHTQWLKKPTVDYVDSRIYSDWDIHYEEQEKIFKKVWIPICHESKIPEINDYRTAAIAEQNIVMINLKEGVRAYENPYNLSVAGNMDDIEWLVDQTELHCEVKYGGMVWVTLDPNPTMDVEQWAAGAFDCIQSALDTEPLEVFHYHKGIMP